MLDSVLSHREKWRKIPPPILLPSFFFFPQEEDAYASSFGILYRIPLLLCKTSVLRAEKQMQVWWFCCCVWIKKLCWGWRLWWCLGSSYSFPFWERGSLLIHTLGRAGQQCSVAALVSPTKEKSLLASLREVKTQICEHPVESSLVWYWCRVIWMTSVLKSTCTRWWILNNAIAFAGNTGKIIQ